MTRKPKPSQPSDDEAPSPYKGAAERDLHAHEERHDDLDPKPLASTARQQYTQDRSSVQEHAVDRPEEAVGEARRLACRHLDG
ncbi:MULTISPECIES: hypothetical protein [unclassified Streptomyces]|uniref:hypothetical protein n=1 Tax=unclassified Streptomyces TaxID=2593676 RepID=UPI002E11C425|nr:hypothetical protein OG395_45370 [Streptomyces sp. NBC_01320]